MANLSSSNVSVLLNDGSGSFGTATNFPTGRGSKGVVGADFDGANGPDLAVANAGSNDVSMLLNDGSGGFGAATSLPVGDGPADLTSADFNGDDKPDLAVANARSNDVSVLLSTTAPANQPPIANDDGYNVNENQTLTVPHGPFDLLINDADTENDPLTATKVSDPSHGTLILNPDGSFSYTPNAGFAGRDTFTYKANDGTNDSDPATVTILVGNCTLFGTDGDDEFAASDSPGNDVICGMNGNDRIDAGAGDDTVRGGEGDDTLLGSTGNDRIFGEAGNDALDARDGVVLNDFADGGEDTDGCLRDFLRKKKKKKKARFFFDTIANCP